MSNDTLDTLDKFMRMVLAILPEAVFDVDNDGQIIVYTNMREVNGTVVPFEDSTNAV